MTSLSAKYGWQNQKTIVVIYPWFNFLLDFFLRLLSWGVNRHLQAWLWVSPTSVRCYNLGPDPQQLTWWPLVRRYLLPRQGLVADVLSRRVDQAAVGEVKYLLVSLTQASNMTFTAVEWRMRIPGNSQHSQSYNPNIFLYRTPIKYSWHYHSCCSLNVCKLNLLSSDGEVLTLLSW